MIGNQYWAGCALCTKTAHYAELDSNDSVIGGLKLDVNMAHAITAVSFEREEDESITTVRVMGSDRSVTVSSDLNPSGRRTAIGIVYYSEIEGGLFMLISVQHKGMETVEIVKCPQWLVGLLVGMEKVDSSHIEKP